MRVILRDNRVVSVAVSDLQYSLALSEEEIAEAPTAVGLGWYRMEGNWFPPGFHRMDKRLKRNRYDQN